MTREEAIAFFKDMNKCTYGNLEAVEMAIKAIKQIDRVLEVVERYKLRIPPNVYYELVADIMNMEGEE